MMSYLPSAPGGFTVMVDGVTNVITSLERDSIGLALVLTVAQDITNAGISTVSYAGSPVITSFEGGVLSPFYNYPMSIMPGAGTNTSSSTPLEIVSAEIRTSEGNCIYLEFNQGINTNSVHLTTGFSITGFSMNAISPVSNNIWRLDVSPALSWESNYTISYSGGASLISTNGDPLVPFSNFMVTNNLASAGSTGTSSSAILIDAVAVLSNQIILTFNMDLTPVPSSAKSNFQIHVAPSSILTVVDIQCPYNGNQILLTLNGGVRLGDFAQVVYSPFMYSTNVISGTNAVSIAFFASNINIPLTNF